MCMSSPHAPQTQVTDPLADLRRGTAQQQYNSYSANLPTLMGMGRNLGNFSTSQAGFPDILNQANTSQSDLLRIASGGPDSGPFAALKQNLLGNFDQGVERYTMNPLRERLIQQGIYSSGPGNDAQSTAGIDAARQRALLGAEQDVNALGMQQNAINSSANLGGQISNILQLLGFSDPMEAIRASQNGPNYQSIETNTYTPQPNPGMGQLGQLLGSFAGPLMSSFGGGGAATSASPANSSMTNFGVPGITGALNPSTYNTGMNYNPSGTGGSGNLAAMLPMALQLMGMFI